MYDTSPFTEPERPKPLIRVSLFQPFDMGNLNSLSTEALLRWRFGMPKENICIR
jgi:hypothetical protein